jgi:ribonucleotide reductase alpha subunit
VGAVYLNAHHPDILRFLDTKRENAEKKVLKRSHWAVIPDITFRLAKTMPNGAVFSPGGTPVRQTLR